jgi:hypothetical protein
MKIVLCGSSFFKKEKLKIKKELIKLGHEVFLDKFTEGMARGELPKLAKEISKDHAKVKSNLNLIKLYNRKILQGEGILVLNYDKKNIKGHIGGNSFLEIGFAFVNNKKIFFLNKIPKMPYTDELKAMNQIIINKDLTKIK